MSIQQQSSSTVDNSDIASRPIDATCGSSNTPPRMESDCTASGLCNLEGCCAKTELDPSVRDWIRKSSLELANKLGPLFPPLEDGPKLYEGRSLLQATMEEFLIGVQESVFAVLPCLFRRGFDLGMSRAFPHRFGPHPPCEPSAEAFQSIRENYMSKYPPCGSEPKTEDTKFTI